MPFYLRTIFLFIYTFPFSQLPCRETWLSVKVSSPYPLASPCSISPIKTVWFGQIALPFPEGVPLTISPSQYSWQGVRMTPLPVCQLDYPHSPLMDFSVERDTSLSQSLYYGVEQVSQYVTKLSISVACWQQTFPMADCLQLKDSQHLNQRIDQSIILLQAVAFFDLALEFSEVLFEPMVNLYNISLAFGMGMCLVVGHSKLFDEETDHEGGTAAFALLAVYQYVMLLQHLFQVGVGIVKMVVDACSVAVEQINPFMLCYIELFHFGRDFVCLIGEVVNYAEETVDVINFKHF